MSKVYEDDYLNIQFNIIYIMRTNVRSGEIRGFVGIVVLNVMAFKKRFLMCSYHHVDSYNDRLSVSPGSAVYYLGLKPVFIRP